MDFTRGNAARLAAIMAFDPEALGPSSLAPRSLTASDDPDADLGVELSCAWRELMRGESAILEPRLASLFASASARRDPALVIEATALRAMVALSQGTLAEAVAFARRASRMARTEGLPPSELLANLVLARVRRKSGKPHLAARIVEALARLAPTATAGWLDWERLLAGGAPVDAAGETSAPPFLAPATPAARAVHAGRRLLHAAGARDRAAFEREVEAVVGATGGFRDMQEEAEVLVALLDVDRAAPESLLPFKHGQTTELAAGLLGAVVFTRDEEPEITVFATARPGRRAGRILREGLGLFGPCRMLSGESGARRAHGRTDAALAALALAIPEALAEDEFFARVYGFAYVPGKHRGVLDVLVHRMRQRLGSSGSVQRAEGTLRLELAEPIAVADPNCSPPAAARILSALARQRLATAEGIAERLGIGVRAAQIALQQLVGDGACAVRRKGRHLEYQLVDTTFSEPTSADALRAGSGSGPDSPPSSVPLEGNVAPSRNSSSRRA